MDSSPNSSSLTTPSFLPGDVWLLGSFPPLVATFDRTECECGAAYMLRALSLNGNSWRAISWTEISEVIKADIASCDVLKEEAPALSILINDMAKNPFARPDFHELASKGYVKWLGEEGKSSLEFTEKGMEKLQRWVLKKVQ